MYCIFEALMKLLQRSRTLFHPLLSGDPEIVCALSHDLTKNSSTNENHVLSPWWIFDTNFEVLLGSGKQGYKLEESNLRLSDPGYHQRRFGGKAA